MTRQQLEHLIRAASVIADDEELIIIGSQSILGAYPYVLQERLATVEIATEHRALITQRIAADFAA